MKRFKFATVGLIAVVVFAVGQKTALAQHEMLKDGESGLVVWTTAAGSGGDDLDGAGFKLGLNDFLEFGVSQLNESGSINEQVVTIGVHVPSAGQQRPIGAALYVNLSDETGLGAEIYGQIELSKRITLAPAIAITLYPDVVSKLNGKRGANITTVGLVLGFEFIEGVMLTVTPQYSSWWDSEDPDVKFVTAGILFFTKDW